jgi:signal transduction histidine kinase
MPCPATHVGRRAVRCALGYPEAVPRLRTEDRSLVFSVQDDGAGFDRVVTPAGAGLTNMADRLAAVGGSLEVLSHPGEGTNVTGRIPLEGFRSVSSR